VVGFVVGVVLVILLGGMRVRRPPPPTWDYDAYRRYR
jgi:hypothetical protein